MLKLSFLLITPIFLAGCATAIPDFVLPKDVRDGAVALSDSSIRTESFMGAQAKYFVRATGNLGIVWKYNHAIQANVTPDGLTDDLTESIPDGRPLPKITTRSLSVCGLIPLLTESVEGGLPGQLAFIPANRSVNVVSYGGAQPTIDRLRINYLKTDTKDICNPTADKTYSFHIRGHMESASIMPVGTIRRVDELDETTTCKTESVGADLKYLEQHGATLLLKCAHKSNQFRPIESKYVFLKKAGRYLKVLSQYSTSADNKFEYLPLKYSAK